jgi:hypothetical protein
MGREYHGAAAQKQTLQKLNSVANCGFFSAKMPGKQAFDSAIRTAAEIKIARFRNRAARTGFATNPCL